MKLFLTPVVFSLAVVMQPVQADLVSDSEQIMNNAQLVYPGLFPSNQTTQIFDPYRYRFYPSTGIYLGINQNNAGVYLLGGSFGDSPYYVDQASNVIVLLNSQLGSSHEQNAVCDTSGIPDGFVYTHSDNTTTVTTNGLCIELPVNSNICEIPAATDANQQPVATGIHVLTQTTIDNLEVSGIDMPGFDLNSVVQQSTNTCLIHAPAELNTHTVHTDVCIDMTNQFSELAGFPGITPPLTSRYTGTTVITRVDSCFNTNADNIFNQVTQELWNNQNGAFVLGN